MQKVVALVCLVLAHAMHVPRSAPARTGVVSGLAGSSESSEGWQSQVQRDGDDIVSVPLHDPGLCRGTDGDNIGGSALVG